MRGTSRTCASSADRRFIPARAGNTFRLHSRRLRFIPARAGEHVGRVSAHGRRTVHPRACGDTACSSWRSIGLGSSPRVRGTRHLERILKSMRFIPARAGEHQTSFAVGFNAVHPRVCGEQLQHPLERQGAPGSSPRVRGTSITPWMLASRFTPARAGNTQPLRIRPSLPRFIPARAGTVRHFIMQTSVHPRGCGEH